MQGTAGADVSALAKIREAVEALGILLSATPEGGIRCSPRAPKALEAAIRGNRAEILAQIQAESAAPETPPSLPTNPPEIVRPGRSCGATVEDGGEWGLPPLEAMAAARARHGAEVAARIAVSFAALLAEALAGDHYGPHRTPEAAEILAAVRDTATVGDR